MSENAEGDEVVPNIRDLLRVWNAAKFLAALDMRSPSYDGEIHRFLELVRR
jgi:hypothetical protein